jgi:hypothetical protein
MKWHTDRTITGAVWNRSIEDLSLLVKLGTILFPGHFFPNDATLGFMLSLNFTSSLQKITRGAIARNNPKRKDVEVASQTETENKEIKQLPREIYND